VDDVSALRALLEAEGQFVGEARQLDEYYSPADRDFLATRPVNEWLRLRDADGRYSMNYKHFYQGTDGKSTHCDEYETQIRDSNQLERILKALNFKKIVTVWLFEKFQ